MPARLILRHRLPTDYARLENGRFHPSQNFLIVRKQLFVYTVFMDTQRNHPSIQQYESLNWKLIEAISRLSVPEKNERAFAAADFALRQKILILTEEYQDWPAPKVEREARRIVYGVDMRTLL